MSAEGIIGPLLDLAQGENVNAEHYRNMPQHFLLPYLVNAEGYIEHIREGL